MWELLPVVLGRWGGFCRFLCVWVLSEGDAVGAARGIARRALFCGGR